MGVYSRPPDQGEPGDKAFLLQIREPSHLQVLILMGDFSHPDICWESWLQEVQETPGVCRGQLPGLEFRQGNQRWGITGPGAHHCG